ncbi:MAG: ATP-binding cassette domain-containing protein [Alphaproteobacteria bacterium]|nr:ATP-binding cassette domain-containing protein [Alphaproteobacteria bacterium]
MSSASSGLEIRHLRLARGDFILEADFALPPQGVTVLFGPSGAGKSLLLSAIAGLTRPDSGGVRLDGRWLDGPEASPRAPAHERRIGLVFQDARLFPHLSVRDNLRYAEARAAVLDAQMSFDEIVAEFGLGDLLGRSVRGLSGGERSRIAIARALLAAPRWLLLDEPFAALDGRRRRERLVHLRDLSARAGLPMIVVTHLVEDAVDLADQVVALRAGRCVISGDVARVMAGEDFLSLLEDRDLGARISRPPLRGSGAETGGGAVWVRADTVILASSAPSGLSARHVWAGRVRSIRREAEGACLVRLETEAGDLLSRVTQEAAEELNVRPGSAVWAVVKTHAF